MAKIGTVVHNKKVLTHGGQWTTDDDRRQPIAIGHLCDSDDLKIQPSLAQGILGQMEFKDFFFQMNGPFSTPFPQEGNNTCIDNF